MRRSPQASTPPPPPSPQVPVGCSTHAISKVAPCVRRRVSQSPAAGAAAGGGKSNEPPVGCSAKHAHPACECWACRHGCRARLPAAAAAQAGTFSAGSPCGARRHMHASGHAPTALGVRLARPCPFPADAQLQGTRVDVQRADTPTRCTTRQPRSPRPRTAGAAPLPPTNVHHVSPTLGDDRVQTQQTQPQPASSLSPASPRLHTRRPRALPSRAAAQRRRARLPPIQTGGSQIRWWWWWRWWGTRRGCQPQWWWSRHRRCRWCRWWWWRERPRPGRQPAPRPAATNECGAAGATWSSVLGKFPSCRGRAGAERRPAQQEGRADERVPGQAPPPAPRPPPRTLRTRGNTHLGLLVALHGVGTLLGTWECVACCGVVGACSCRAQREEGRSRQGGARGGGMACGQGLPGILHVPCGATKKTASSVPHRTRHHRSTAGRSCRGSTR